MEAARAARAWREAGVPAVVVEVRHTRGSAPRDAGTYMLVSAHRVHGTIGGGHLEARAIEIARAQLDGRAAPKEQTFALGPSLGQCCGGSVTLHWTPLGEVDPERLAPPPPRFHLQLHGAGHVGRAIAALLATLPCRVQWIDQRDDAFPADPTPTHIERVSVAAVEAEVALAPPGACYLVLTHRHDLDLAIVSTVLRRGDFAFLGLIGSATKKARFEHRLLAQGVPRDRVARMTCPIGLPGITGKEPEVIAVAAVAQLLQAASARSD